MPLAITARRRCSISSASGLGEVLASTSRVTRSGGVHREPLADHATERETAEREPLHLQGVRQPKHILGQAGDGVVAGDNRGGAVATSVVAQESQVRLQILDLLVPHRVVEPEGMRQR